MEWKVESRETEQRRIFFILKNMFMSGGTTKKFKRLKPLKYNVDIETWQHSVYNNFIKSTYCTIYSREIQGKITWIVQAEDTNRQYLLEMNK